VDNETGDGDDRPIVDDVSAGLAVPPLMTAEQLFELPDDGLRHELVEGVLVTMSPAGPRHGRVSLRIGARLDAFCESHPGTGAAFGNDTGFLVRRAPDTVRAPDVAFIGGERGAMTARAAAYPELAPDLVVEVVSPNDRASEVTAKAVAWLDAGVRLVWVVDPQARIVVVHRPGGTSQVLREGDALDGEDVVPVFAG
jgi:Uma2 family endonuclease